jgi:radical S-adenosyl methionine domain-containing protein 2
VQRHAFLRPQRKRLFEMAHMKNVAWLSSATIQSAGAMQNIFPQRQPCQLVINWHLTEACNYSCRYCYARWDERVDERELIHDSDRTRRMLADLAEFFAPDNDANPLKREMDWASVRLNLAGGEPLLYRQRTLEVVSMAREIGFDVSMISNGSHFDPSSLEVLAPKLSLLGISLDSMQQSVNREIGRVDRQGRLLALDNLADVVSRIRTLNPSIRLKINTVVNALNCEEDMNAMIGRLSPDRWKVLRMLPVVTNNLAVSDSQFNGFVERHRALEEIMCVEDSNSLSESYIMIDPHGRFFQNSMAEWLGGYQYSRPILQTGAQDAFSDLRFSTQKFLTRYDQPTTVA